MEFLDKGFICALPFVINQFIGIYDGYLYVSADTEKQLRIYKKRIIDSGDWKLVWTKFVRILPSKGCGIDCGNGRISVYGMTENSILCFYATGTWSNINFNLIKLDLKTFKETQVRCNFNNTDFFMEHFIQICNECQNSNLRCRNFNDSSIILTHFRGYLTTMAFDIDFSNGELGQHQITFNDDFENDNSNSNFKNEISNVAINSEGVVAFIANKKLLRVEFKLDGEISKEWFSFDELSDSPQLEDYAQIHLYSVGSVFKCIVWYNGETHKCFNISFNSETSKFTLLNAKQIPSFDLVEPYDSFELFITDEYFFIMDPKEMFTVVARVLSLSELSYLAFQKIKKISVNQLKNKLEIPQFLPLVQPPKIVAENVTEN